MSVCRAETHLNRLRACQGVNTKAAGPWEPSGHALGHGVPTGTAPPTRHVAWAGACGETRSDSMSEGKPCSAAALHVELGEFKERKPKGAEQQKIGVGAERRRASNSISIAALDAAHGFAKKEIRAIVAVDRQLEALEPQLLRIARQVFVPVVRCSRPLSARGSAQRWSRSVPIRHVEKVRRAEQRAAAVESRERGPV